MGADYTAITVIGVCLPHAEDLPKAKVMARKRAFDHDYDESYEFHPKSGDKLWLDEQEEVEADYPAIILDQEGYIEEDEIKEGQRVVDLTDIEGLDCTCSTDNYRSFFGYVLETGSSNGGQSVCFEALPDIQKIKTQIKEKLEPLGLWDEEEFGVYSILYCSY